MGRFKGSTGPLREDTDDRHPSHRARGPTAMRQVCPVHRVGLCCSPCPEQEDSTTHRDVGRPRQGAAATAAFPLGTLGADGTTLSSRNLEP